MKKIELLAPAGGPEQFIAAVNAGADAVYLGGSLFNARIGAGNFTLEEMKEALDYGHLRGVKTYVTLNTLMSDSDINQALKYAIKLYELGVDALIIQDLGLGYAIREAIPDFELHLSTQATIYDPEGVIASQQLGYKRTVLSRELTLDEIRSCANVGEVEVFIHGALCICYSGQCQLSRFIGGRSGNKGMCAQPCRLPYTYRDTSGHIISSGNPLSPKDMCQIENLGELIDAGVSSLKIEGRMKSAEYVATVVSIYRKYIDEYYAHGSYSVAKDDMNSLLQAFNRDGFTCGYLHGDPEDELMTSGISKNTGVYAGNVARNSGRNSLVDITAKEDISMHDVLEIRGKSESTSFKVTYLRPNPSGKLTVGDIKEPVHAGDKVYRIISVEQSEKASAIAQMSKKVPADVYIQIHIGSPVEITAKDISSGISFTFVDPDICPQPALKAALSENDIIRQINKSGETAFYIRHTRINIDKDSFLPVSKLNSIRRRVLEGLESAIISSFTREFKGDTVFNTHQTEGISYSKVSEISENTVILPAVTKGNYDKWLRANITKLASQVNTDGASIVVSNPAWIKPLSEAGVKVIGGPGLNITNNYTVTALMELGMSDEYVLSPELLDRSEMDGIPLMITEHRMIPGTLTDRKGSEYLIEYNDEQHKTYIFAK